MFEPGCEIGLVSQKSLGTNSASVTHTCSMCNFTTPWKSHLKRHFVVHTGVRPFSYWNVFKEIECSKLGGVTYYTCSLCAYKTPNKSHLKRHQVVHTGERPYVCPICKKGFTQRDTLKYHVALHCGLVNFC
ncbi:gastrula zinc finger protein XlCGF28.1-like [Parasteatoda tepidariorum]|uniref:gastrula zinc finger protein XlCGF28.1-like n=1 Tax=Parasteatoda tepidariorum TaxID=114398 RepID=UPI0039BC7FBE